MQESPGLNRWFEESKLFLEKEFSTISEASIHILSHKQIEVKLQDSF